MELLKAFFRYPIELYDLYRGKYDGNLSDLKNLHSKGKNDRLNNPADSIWILVVSISGRSVVNTAVME